MLSYSKIDFGLKHHQTFFDSKEFMELIDSLRIIISEHDASTDCCDRPGLHYHGIIEHEDLVDDDENTIVRLKMYCTYFRIEKCNSPEQYIVYLAEPNKKFMHLGISKSIELKTYYLQTKCNLVIRSIPSRVENDNLKRLSIETILKYILCNSIFDPKEIRKHIEKKYNGLLLNQPENIIVDALALARQKMIDMSILELCCRPLLDIRYSPNKSAEMVKEWCVYQNINFKDLTMNLVHCLDKQIPFRNTLYFRDAPDSGISFVIGSIVKACTFIGNIDNETTGYTYVWGDCLDKRCIVLQNPVFEQFMLEELENILKGIGTYVPHQLDTLKYLRPTPVIIISNKTEWESDISIQHLQNSFIQIYDLKPFSKLDIFYFPLHPDWLRETYYSQEINTFMKPMDCESSSIEFSNLAASESSPTSDVLNP